MNIAVNTRLLLRERMEGIGYFEQEVFTRIARAHPEHHFYFFFDRETVKDPNLPSNVTEIVLGPPTRHPLLWKYWFDFRISIALKKIRADVFVSPDGFLSLTTKTPQCLVIHDLGFLHYPEAYKWYHLAYLRHYTPRFIKKAQSVATVSAFTKNDIISHYKTDTSKIDVVFSGVKEKFRPCNETERKETREKYTGGHEYFIYAGAIQPRKNLVNLLKAYTVFKKRQKSNWKLVLAGRLAWKNDEFLQLLKTYKHKDDVILTGYVAEEEMVKLIGSAYALIYPSFFEGFGVPVLEAMKAGIPPLTSKGTSMEEIAGEAALYFDPNDPADIAEKMMLIYKDENYRNRLIERGKVPAVKFSWDRTATLMWQCILLAVSPDNA
jgi:glycosyltransferase involved in cell wall biosynthesis